MLLIIDILAHFMGHNFFTFYSAVIPAVVVQTYSPISTLLRYRKSHSQL